MHQTHFANATMQYIRASLLKLIVGERVTYSHCVPSIMQMLLSHPDSASYDLTGWKVLIGGSAMSETLALAALRRGIEVVTGYGMSETCPVVTIAHPSAEDARAPLEEQARLRCKTGLPLPLTDLRVVTPEMADLRGGAGTDEHM